MPWPKSYSREKCNAMYRKWYKENRAAELRDIGNYRECKKCRITKLRNEANFRKHPNGRLGYMARCRDCVPPPVSYT